MTDKKQDIMFRVTLLSGSWVQLWAESEAAAVLRIEEMWGTGQIQSIQPKLVVLQNEPVPEPIQNTNMFQREIDENERKQNQVRMDRALRNQSVADAYKLYSTRKSGKRDPNKL